MGEGPRYTEWPIASLIAEIERLQYNLGQIVIANAEVAKLNAEQAETIERLRAALEWYADDTGNLDEYIEDKGKRAREALRGIIKTAPYTDEVSRKLWTEDADGNPRRDPL